MKRAVLIFVVVAIALASAWTQPKVAVLDAIIPQNMDPSVIVPTTEKIIERLVISGRFTVLDRANIEGILKEREFQISGMVSDQDVVAAGKYLGADFVVVAKVQKVGETYFISAKMIAIKTGVIANQTSAQGEGKLSTLIDLAAQVGEVLSGGAVLAQSAAGGQKDISKPEATAQKAARSEPVSSPASDNFFGVGALYSYDLWSVKASDSSTQYTGTDAWNFGDLVVTYSGKYFQIGLGYASSMGGDHKYTNTNTNRSGSEKITDTRTFVIFDGRLKYPIRVGTFTFFPMAGIQYDLNLTWKNSKGDDLKKGLSSSDLDSLNLLYLEIGAGLELKVGSMFLCPEVMFGYKIPSKADTDYKDYLTSTIGWTTATVSETKLDIGAIVGFPL